MKKALLEKLMVIKEIVQKGTETRLQRALDKVSNNSNLLIFP